MFCCSAEMRNTESQSTQLRAFYWHFNNTQIRLKILIFRHGLSLFFSLILCSVVRLLCYITKKNFSQSFAFFLFGHNFIQFFSPTLSLSLILALVYKLFPLIACFHYLTHFICNGISQCCSRKISSSFLFFASFFFHWTLHHSPSVIQPTHITDSLHWKISVRIDERKLQQKPKYKFLSLEGSKFIQQIATNTTNSATHFFGSLAKWPKTHSSI